MDSFIISQIKKNKKGWIKSFEENFSQDNNGQALPWMTYGIIDYFNEYLDKDKVIFEYGFGASTFFFAKKVKKVVVIETNAMWYKVMNDKLRDEGISNVEVFLMQDALDNEAYENFAQNYGEKFDIIIVDSIKRYQCCVNAVNALKENGLFVLDDSQRKGYQKIFQFFEEYGFRIKNFIGVAPGQFRLKNSTIFYRSL